jgi:signal peptidase I
MSFLQLLVVPLAWLALPVILVVLYDVFVLAPQRPKTPEGETPPGPAYVRVAHFLLPFVIAAAVIHIGVSEVFGWAKEVAEPLSWLAVPVGLWCAIDSWFFAPRRMAAQGPAAKDPALLRVMYAILPVLVIAIIIRLISAESLDFSLVLLVLSLVTGAIWGIDHFLVRKRREQALAKRSGAQAAPPEPGTVDYARSFFPVAAIVLVVRAFIFEPFRIPSDSMMPTLLDGDFIVVSKFSYGLRWPVLNEKFLHTGSPQRGDVVVFRKPGEENVNYIKRLVGLPGDRIEVRDDHLVINGETLALDGQGRYGDGCYHNVQHSTEKIGEHTHQVFSCRSNYGLLYARTLGMPVEYGKLPACNRKSVVERVGAYLCEEPAAAGVRDSGDHVFPVIPAGHYLMIGDNRDNSEDSRVWGLVPEKNLVGKATRIWLNFDPGRPGIDVLNWRRMGDKID